MQISGRAPEHSVPAPGLAALEHAPYHITPAHEPSSSLSREAATAHNPTSYLHPLAPSPGLQQITPAPESLHTADTAPASAPSQAGRAGSAPDTASTSAPHSAEAPKPAPAPTLRKMASSEGPRIAPSALAPSPSTPTVYSEGPSASREPIALSPGKQCVTSWFCHGSILHASASPWLFWQSAVGLDLRWRRTAQSIEFKDVHPSFSTYASCSACVETHQGPSSERSSYSGHLSRRTVTCHQ